MSLLKLEPVDLEKIGMPVITPNKCSIIYGPSIHYKF